MSLAFLKKGFTSIILGGGKIFLSFKIYIEMLFGKIFL